MHLQSEQQATRRCRADKGIGGLQLPELTPPTPPPPKKKKKQPCISGCNSRCAPLKEKISTGGHTKVMRRSAPTTTSTSRATAELVAAHAALRTLTHGYNVALTPGDLKSITVEQWSKKTHTHTHVPLCAIL